MEPIPRSRGRRTVDLLCVGVFALAVGLPVYGLLFKKPPRLEENRERYAFPPISTERRVIEKFPADFELYLGDRIGYRDVLLSWHRRLIFGVLDEPVTAKVWIGKDGWLFLYVKDPFEGIPQTPSVAARIAMWADAFEARHAYLKARGIEYIVVVAPDKADIYPEYLRGYPSRHPTPETGTPLAKLLAERGVPCANLLPGMLAEKRRDPRQLYFKTDSHWTPAGAHVGYKALSQAVTERFPEFRMTPDSAYTPSRLACGGDLRRLAGTPDDEPMETTPCHVPLTGVTYRDAPDYFSETQRAEHLNGRKDWVSAQPSASGPNTLFLHDSFGDYLKPYLRSDFTGVCEASTYGLPLEALRVEQPKLVIQLLVARQVYCLLPTNPPGVGKGTR